MLKYLKLLFVFILIFLFILVFFINFGKYKVLDVPDYKTAVLDLNHNFQIDSDEAITFDELYIPDTLSSEDRFLLEYLALREAQHFLLHKYVTYEPETKSIQLNDTDFLQHMTSSHLVLNSNSKDVLASEKAKLLALLSSLEKEIK